MIFVLTQAQANAFQGGHDFQPSDTGLWVLPQGRWELHGFPLLRTWSKLADDAAAGSATLVVEHDLHDWYVGGQIVVTATGNPRQSALRTAANRTQTESIGGSEVRTITAVSLLANGQTQLTLDQPLTFDHAGAAPMQGEVALLSRNVVVRTELVGVDEATYADVRTRQFAHTIYMPNAKGNLQYGEFKQMGHYGITGRYMIHLHRMLASSAGMIVRGNSGWQTGFRCVNLHITHGVLVEDNVCYNASSTAYFVEEDNQHTHETAGYVRGYSQDNLFVHNIAIDTSPKHFDDRSDPTIAGEGRRVGSFWPGAETQHEAYLGNVAAGIAGYGDAGGFVFPESGNEIASTGAIPFTFVNNEVHSVDEHGIFSWQNTTVERELVATRLWRNGSTGIRWGAYSMPAHYFNTQLLENGESGLNITSVNVFLQDSTITGASANNATLDTGVVIGGYVMPQYPNPGVWLVRNHFANLQTYGISQVQKTVSGDNVAGSECVMHDFAPGPPSDLKVRPVYPGECSAVYITLMGNQFENVAQPLFFGQQPNPNSWWKVFDYTGDSTTPSNFVLLRADQGQAAHQGVITKRLYNAQATYHAGFDALLLPMTSLPATGIEFTGLLNHRLLAEQSYSPSPDFTFTTQADYPPTVTLAVTLDGTTATLQATATDDHQVARIEFFVDWVNVATVTPTATAGTTIPAPATSLEGEVKVDLSKHPRKYAYLYVRAFDGTRQVGNDEQRAYSNVVEIGPEILPASAPEPAAQRLYLPLISK
ncbi:MAG: hypothetical protein R3E79_17875 [Caldilineaceae bacterium]